MATDIRPLSPDLLEPAFELATRVFTEASTLHRALGISLTDYQRYLRRPFELMANEELSIAASDRATGRLTGCLILTDFINQLNPEPATEPVFAPLAALTGELCRQYRQRRDIKAGEMVLVDMGVVRREVRGEGVYGRMRSAAQEVAKQRGFHGIVGELSSVATQHMVLNRLGHSRMAEVFFKEFEFEGRRPFYEIEDPASIVLASGAL
jgi:hypothetical protein